MADKRIKTGGGSLVEGDVDTGGGDFTGRDRINQPVQQVTSTTNIFRENPTLGILAVVAILAMLVLGIVGIYALAGANRSGDRVTPLVAPVVTQSNVVETAQSAAETTTGQAASSVTTTATTAIPLLAPANDTPVTPAPAQPTPVEPAASPPTGQTPAGGRIGISQTVTGTLYSTEGASWIFGDGPAVIDVVLALMPSGAPLLMMFDADGAGLQYVEAQTQGIARMLNYAIPDDREYTFVVRNQTNSRADYTLTVQPARPPQRIGLGETVTGTLYYNEGASWIFNDGPAVVDILLEMGSQDAALLIVSDSEGVQRQYVEAQTPGEARLLNFSIADDGAYTLFVRNQNNTRAGYRLTVLPAGAVQNP